jgi:hypothetical protein
MTLVVVLALAASRQYSGAAKTCLRFLRRATLADKVLRGSTGDIDYYALCIFVRTRSLLVVSVSRVIKSTLTVVDLRSLPSLCIIFMDHSENLK